MELKPIFVAVGSRIRLMMDGQIIRCESARMSGFLEAAVTYPPHVYTAPHDVEGVAQSDQADSSNVDGYVFQDPYVHVVDHDADQSVLQAAYEASVANDAIDVNSLTDASDDEEKIDLVIF